MYTFWQSLNVEWARVLKGVNVVIGTIGTGNFEPLHFEIFCGWKIKNNEEKSYCEDFKVFEEKRNRPPKSCLEVAACCVTFQQQCWISLKFETFWIFSTYKPWETRQSSGQRHPFQSVCSSLNDWDVWRSCSDLMNSKNPLLTMKKIESMAKNIKNLTILPKAEIPYYFMKQQIKLKSSIWKKVPIINNKFLRIFFALFVQYLISEANS